MASTSNKVTPSRKDRATQRRHAATCTSDRRASQITHAQAAGRRKSHGGWVN